MYGMTQSQLDHLDGIAAEVKAGNDARVGPLSTGEALYVALAANSAPLLKSAGYTIVEALARVGEDDVAELIKRWRYKG